MVNGVVDVVLGRSYPHWLADMLMLGCSCLFSLSNIIAGRDQLWWHPMLAGHGVRAEEANMVFEIQMVIVIHQMLRLMSPRASRAC